LHSRAVKSSGHTPTYIAHAELTQDNTDPFPNGYLLVVVMSKITGEHIPDIAPDLSEEDLAVIWK